MATRTIANGGGNYNTAGTWVEGIVPTSSDDVVATATSGQLTIDQTTCVAKTVDFTNYVNTLTFTAAKILTVSGNFKMVVGMTVTGTGSLKLNATATLTSAGQTFPGILNFIAAATYTLADSWTVTGNVLTATGAAVLNGNTLTCNASLTIQIATSGTTSIVLGGTGTWSHSGNTVTIANSITINTSGTITLGSTTVLTGGASLTYITGTVITTSSTLYLNAGAITLNTNGITFNNISGTDANSASTPTVTLGSNLTMSGELAVGATGTKIPFQGLTFVGAFNVSCATLSLNAQVTFTFPASQTLTATSSIIMNGNDKIVPLMKSGTASTSFFLNFTGPITGNKVFMGSFTDVDASGSAQPIKNYFGGNPGGVLTRTVNIINQNLPITVTRAVCG